jgi:hypothetical protein
LGHHGSSFLRTLSLDKLLDKATFLIGGVGRHGEKKFVDEMSLDPISHQCKFDSPTILTIVINLFEHPIEPFKSEQPPGIDWTEKLDHRGEVHGKVVIDGELDTNQE